jgi:short-subunit dehydrogenase
MDIAGRVVVVTGASSGIGEACARLAAREGARLVLAARRTQRLAALAAELPDAFAVTTDLRVPEQVRAMVDATLDHYGRVDVLVNNSGQGLHVPLEEVVLDDLQAVMELNVYAPLLAMQAVVPLMRAQGGGAIVNVSSGTTRMVIPGLGPYSSTKSMLNQLSATARAEWAGDGIVVSTVYPGATATEFHQSLRAGSFKGGRIEPRPPESVAEAILLAIKSGEAEVVPGQPPADL